MCCGLRHYVPYQYTKGHAEGICASFKNPDKSICCRIAAVAYHALATLICTLVDTLLSACRVVYVAIAPGGSSSGSKTSIDPVPNPGGTVPVEPPPGPAPLKPPPQPAPQPLAATPLPPVEEDLGIGTPTWYCTRNLRGEEVYSLCRFPPFHFHKDPKPQITAGGLVHEKFTLSNGKIDLGKLDAFGQFNWVKFPAITFQCPALEEILQSPGLKDSLPQHALHCSEEATVNMDQDLRKDYAMHEGADTYRFIYPAQLSPDPEKAQEFVRQLMQNRNIPPFLKGLLLIGGYAYYDKDGHLLQVKSFSASSDATEILPTGKALDPELIGFPSELLKNFKLGVAITSGNDNYEGQNFKYFKNALSPYANSITAPSLKYLKHFAYIPQSLYKGNKKMTDAAPLGGFLYQTVAGEYQFVPIGGDFLKAAEQPLDPGLTPEQVQQYNKRRVFASLFYKDGSTRPSLEGIEGLSSDRRIFESHSNRVRLPPNYTITALEGRKIEISKGSQKSIARISEQGAIDECADVVLFQQWIDEVMPPLMSKMVKAEGDRLSTIRESIEFAPEEHLKVLTNTLRYRGAFSVNYLDLNERRYIAIDASGPGRDYLAEVMKAVPNYSLLFDKTRDPKGPEDGLYFLQHSVDVSDPKNRFTLESIGTLFDWVISQNGKYPVGRRFSSAFFKYLHFCLTHNPHWTNEELLDLHETCNPGIKKVMDLLKRGSPPETQKLAKDQPSDMDATYSLLDGLDMEELAVADPYAKIKQDWNSIKEKAKAALAEQIRNQVLPAYQILADSLRANPYARMSSVADLELMIQGQADTRKIADAIQYLGGRGAVRDKVEWIKDWIRDKNTPRQEIDDFIKAATGSTLLGLGQKININDMPVFDASNAFPVYHTCFRSIDMPFGQALDQGTREERKGAFMRSFKLGITAALAAPNGFSMH